MEENDQNFEKACLLKERGDIKEALAIFATIYQSQGNNFNLILHLGECHWKLKELEPAYKYFLLATDLFPESEYASKCIFYTLWGMGKKDEAMAEIKRLYPFAYPQEYKDIVEEVNQRKETED